MLKYHIEVLQVERLGLGEGPHWDPLTQQLYYVSLMGREIHRYDPSTKQEFKATIDTEDHGKVPTTLSIIIPIESKPNHYIINIGKTLHIIEWDGFSPTVSPKKKLAVAKDGVIFNDGKCDANGRLWIGTCGNDWVNFDNPEIQGTGVLYRLDSTRTLEPFERDIKLSNGLAWSLDNTRLYYIDSATNRVDVYDYDLEAGIISNRHPLFDYKRYNEEGLLDGMCSDSNGNLWVATFDGYSVINIDGNTGKLIRTIEFPVPTTSCTFGGRNLDILYVTTTKTVGMKGDRSYHPDAGATFQVTGLGVEGAASGGVPFKESRKLSDKVWISEWNKKD